MAPDQGPPNNSPQPHLRPLPLGVDPDKAANAKLFSRPSTYCTVIPGPRGRSDGSSRSPQSRAATSGAGPEGLLASGDAAIALKYADPACTVNVPNRHIPAMVRSQTPRNLGARPLDGAIVVREKSNKICLLKL